MSEMDIDEEVRKAVAKVAGLQPAEVSADASFDDYELDSLSRIEILVELERTFKLKIPEEEYSEEELVGQVQTVRQAIELVHRFLSQDNAQP